MNSLLNPAKLLVAVCFANPKNNAFKCLCPVYRVSGTSRKQFVMPDIGLRAVQGHSTRSDVGLEYLIAAQESLRAEQEDLPLLCVHGTDPTAWTTVFYKHIHLSLAALQAAGLLSTLL